MRECSHTRRGRAPRAGLASLLVAMATMVQGCPGAGSPTGIDLTISHDAGTLSLDQVSLSLLQGETLWYGPDDLLDPTRELGAAETLYIYLPGSMGGQRLAVQVVGRRDGRTLASGRTEVALVTGELVPAEVTLLPGGFCGDGWCADDEDGCGCPGDCSPNGCGDGICCPAGGEDSESCPGDCPACGDGDCDPGEDGCSCPEDCAPAGCGDGICCAERGETRSNCPEDCCQGLFGLNANLRREAASGADLDDLATLVAGTGVGVVRSPLEWFLIQPSAPPAPRDWGPLDAEARALDDAGLCSLRFVIGTPTWASSNPGGDPPQIYPPSNPADMAAFAAEAAERYGRAGSGQVNWWQFWNRPDLPARFAVLAPADRPTAFAELWDAADEAVGQADPGAARLAPSLTAAPQPQPVAFRADLWAVPGIEDRIGLIDYQLREWNVTTALQRVAAELATAGLDQRPIWIGEIANAQDGLTDDADQARALVARHALLLGEAARLSGPDRPGVQRVLWGQLVDRSSNPLAAGHAGLLHRPGYDPKLSYYAFSEMVRRLGQADPASTEVLEDGAASGRWALRIDGRGMAGPVVVAFWWAADEDEYLRQRAGQVEWTLDLDAGAAGSEHLRVRQALPDFFGQRAFACFSGQGAQVSYDAGYGIDLDGSTGTLRLWIRPASAGDDGEQWDLFDYQPGQDASLRLVKGANGRLRASFEVNAQSEGPQADVTSWRPGQWVLVELEWDRDAGVSRLWLDGRLADRGPAVPELPAGPGSLRLGGAGFAGCLDEVVLLEASLSDRPAEAGIRGGIPFDGTSGIIGPLDDQPGPPGQETSVRYEAAAPDPPGASFAQRTVDAVGGRVELTVGKTPIYVFARE